MAKITSKASLSLGTNVQLNLVDFQGTDIAISATNSQITSTTTDFTASNLTAGLNKRAIAVGDEIHLAHTANAANEGVVLAITAVAANQLDFTVVSGSPADESAGADINITATKKTYQFLEAGGLSFVDGVQGLVFNSWMTDLWDASDLDIYPRPFTSIEPRAKSIASINGWEPEDNSTLSAIRDTALEIRPTATAAATRIYSLLRSTSNLHAATDQMTYWPDSDPEANPPNNFVMTGYANQLVLIYDADNSIDLRASNGVTWHTRCAEAGKTIVYESHSLEYAEIYPVSANNAIDPKLADPGTGVPYHDDTTLGGAGYASILYYSDVDGLYDGDVNGTLYSFYGYIDANGQTNEEVHEKINYLWRQPTNINSDGTGATFRGDKQPPMTTFSGDVFTVQSYLLNYNSAQRNNLRLVDTSGVTRQWPIIYTLTVAAPAIAQGGTFSLIHKDTYGASAPTYLQDETGTPQKDITIASAVSIVIAYSSYNVDGHTPNTPIELVLTWNKPGAIEPDFNDNVVMGASNQTVTITPTPDPSYTTA